MSWSEVLLTLGLSTLFGLPVLGFTLYWVAEFLGLRVDAKKRRLSDTEAAALHAQLAALQTQVEQLQGSWDRVAQLEEQIAFVERLLDERASAGALPPGAGDPPHA